MATYALSIKPYKPYAIPVGSKGRAAWFVRLRRSSVRASAQIQQWSRRISPWYDESEHGNTLVMWS